MVMKQLDNVDFVQHQQINRLKSVDLDRLLFHQIVGHNHHVLIIPVLINSKKKQTNKNEIKHL